MSLSEFDEAGPRETMPGGDRPGLDWPGFILRVIRLLLVSFVVFVMLVGLVASLGGVLGRQWWLAEITTHFRVPLALGLTMCAVVLLMLRSYGFAALALLGAAVNMAFVAALYLPATDPSRYDSHNLNILFADLGPHSTDYAAVASLVRLEQPDVALFNGVSSDSLAGLAPLNEAYPHRVAVARDDGHGVAFFSRLPLDRTVTTTLGTLGIPAIASQAMVQDAPVTLTTARPPAPTTAELAAERNRQLADLATLVRNGPAPKILCGDLGTTPWSPFFVDLLNGTGLLNTRQGYGVLGTWKADWPPMLALPLDHCLVSPDVAVRALRRGPRVGSDHLPLLVTLAVSRP